MADVDMQKDNKPKAEGQDNPRTAATQTEKATYRNKGINCRIINISLNPYNDANKSIVLSN